jgi:hypothetical protein
MKHLSVIMLLLCGALWLFASCSDDDDDVTLHITVAIRDDMHVPEYVTVFGRRQQLSDDLTWVVTIESFRIHEFNITVSRNRLPSYIEPILRSDDPRIDGIFSFEPSRYSTSKTLAIVHTEWTTGKYSFTLTPP